MKPYSLRHNYARHLLCNGAELRAIQAALGHTDLRTTAIYLHADEERMRDVAHLAALTPSMSIQGQKPQPVQPSKQPKSPDPQSERQRQRVRLNIRS